MKKPHPLESNILFGSVKDLEACKTEEEKKEYIEKLKKEKEERTQKIIKKWDEMEPFKDHESIPLIPILDDETYQKHIVPNIIRCGGIPKSELEKGATYLGDCRNASKAIWNGEKFVYVRNKFGITFNEKINHFEDDEGYDVFIPIKKL